MVAQDLYEVLRAQPFKPFRIHLADGRSREVRHPDEVLVLRTRVILPLDRRHGEVPEGTEHISMAHVVSIEEPIAQI